MESMKSMQRPLLDSLICWADSAKYEVHYGAAIAVNDFLRLYRRRDAGFDISTMKAMDAAFSTPVSDEEREIYWLILKWDAKRVIELERGYFHQMALFNEVSRDLVLSATASKLKRRTQIQASLRAISRHLAVLRRAALLEGDSQLFPGMHAPVLVAGGDGRQVRPMIFGMRIGDAAHGEVMVHEVRRQDLADQWEHLSGCSHGVVVASAILTKVPTEKIDPPTHPFPVAPDRPHRSQAAGGEPFLIPCLCINREGRPESFLPITDGVLVPMQTDIQPRHLVTLGQQDLARWLNPGAQSSQTLDELLSRSSVSAP